MSSGDATQLLIAAERGDEAAATHLMPLVYDELRRLAARYLARERGAEVTLQPTAIVHEAFLRLIRKGGCDQRSRTHFFAAAAQAMRHVLIDHVRALNAAKRGGGDRPLAMVEAHAEAPDAGPAHDLLALNERLECLAELSPRAARVVELRVFGGLANRDIAAVLEVSERTVREDWRVARAWLRAAFRREEDDDHA